MGVSEAAMRHAALPAALCALLAGCSTLRTSVEYNPKADFSSYKTYAWSSIQPGPEEAQAIRNPAFYSMVRAAVDRELAARSLTPDQSGRPDLFVIAHGMAQDRIEVTSYGYAYAPVYYGPYGPVMMGPAGVDVRQYRDGTLLLDLVDAKTSQLVWRGTASDTVSSTSEVQGVVNNAVKTILAEYPPKKESS